MSLKKIRGTTTRSARSLRRTRRSAPASPS